MSPTSLAVPFFFGPETSRMFGLYQEPEGARRDTAELICSSSGWELTAIHRTLRALASQFSRRGFPVLRFDLPGSGDWDGDDELASEENYVAAVSKARAELASRSGCVAVGAVGYGAGAGAIATALGRDGSLFRDVVLWDADLGSVATSLAIESVDSSHAVLADSSDRVSSQLASRDTAHPVRKFELLRNDRDSWSLEQAYESVAVPGAMLNAIVQWSVKRW